MTDILKSLAAPVNPNIPDLRAGDIVNVHVMIKEGERERIQEFKGTIIRVRNSGNNANRTRCNVKALGDVPPPFLWQLQQVSHRVVIASPSHLPLA